MMWKVRICFSSFCLQRIFKQKVHQFTFVLAERPSDALGGVRDAKDGTLLVTADDDEGGGGVEDGPASCRTAYLEAGTMDASVEAGLGANREDVAGNIEAELEIGELEDANAEAEEGTSMEAVDDGRVEM